jgi:hypothetical protein
MRFEAMLGAWVFGVVCVVIVIVTLALKLNYEKNQKMRGESGKATDKRAKVG